MKVRAISVLTGVLLLVGSVLSTAAQPATPMNSPILSGSIYVEGLMLFSWISDDICSLSFSDYDPSPELLIKDEDGRIVRSLGLMGAGKVTLAEEGGTRRAVACTVPFSVGFEYRGGDVTVEIDPYYSTLVPDDRLTIPLSIAITRTEGDPAPDYRDRRSGPIIGTDTFRIAGTLQLMPSDDVDRLNYFTMPLVGCVGMGGFEDVSGGAQIVVRNESAEIIAVGSLEGLTLSSDLDGPCVFIFDMEVPRATFYSVEMGRRGGTTYSFAEMEAQGWRLDLRLG